MAAYLIFTRESTHNQTELDKYEDMIKATFAGHNIKVLAAYGRHEVLEGPNTEGVVIAEFPTMEEAKAWYNSPAYQQGVIQHRFLGSVYRGIIVQGV